MLMNCVQHIMEHEGENATTTITLETLQSGRIALTVLTERYSTGRSMYSADPQTRVVLTRAQLMELRTAINKALLLLEMP